MTINQLISLMLDIKPFYSRELKCTNLVVTKTLGYEQVHYYHLSYQVAVGVL